MSVSSTKGKMGRKRLFEEFEEIGNSSEVEGATKSLEASASSEARGPLHGVVVCLTGLPSDRKNALHSLVEKLGGRYVDSVLPLLIICHLQLGSLFSQLYPRFQC